MKTQFLAASAANQPAHHTTPTEQSSQLAASAIDAYLRGFTPASSATR